MIGSRSDRSLMYSELREYFISHWVPMADKNPCPWNMLGVTAQDKYAIGLAWLDVENRMSLMIPRASGGCEREGNWGVGNTEKTAATVRIAVLCRQSQLYIPKPPFVKHIAATSWTVSWKTPIPLFNNSGNVHVMDREFYRVMGDVMSFEFSSTNPPTPSHTLHSSLLPPSRFYVDRVGIIGSRLQYQVLTVRRQYVRGVGRLYRQMIEEEHCGCIHSTCWNTQRVCISFASSCPPNVPEPPP
jgi:hypothetical protein